MLLAGAMLKSEKPTFNISPVGAFFWGGVVCFWLGNVKFFFENVLLAGEMLKSEKPTFNISPGGYVLLAGEMLNFFSKMCFWLGKF